MSGHAIRNFHLPGDIRQARLNEVARRHKKRSPGYTTFRNGRPHVRVNRKNQQRNEHLLAWGAIAVVIVCAGVAGSGGF